MFFHDMASVGTMIWGQTEAILFKVVLWHEYGHLLGLGDGAMDPNDTTSIMNTGKVGSQAELDATHDQMDNAHWCDAEADVVREDYVPNAQ